MTIYYKMRQILLQIATDILLQNATFITNCDSNSSLLWKNQLQCLVGRSLYLLKKDV